MTTEKKKLLRKIPSMDILLEDPELKKSAEGVSRRVVLEVVRSVTELTRKRLLEGTPAEADEDSIRQGIVALAKERIAAATRRHYRRAVNATGIILHTGLGRAVLAPEALRQIQEELAGYSVLQLGVESGKRSMRDERIESLLKQLTGAEAATVVNNNAAATMLVLNTVARGREVIVSRGQLVEIGGSFRLPDVMAASGAVMVEVGTTNKTHLRDYENAINENTAAILRVHPSNYRIVGFSTEVGLPELVSVAHAHDLVLIDDVGAGALIDFSRFGFQKEPMLRESLAAGSDLVTSSADKLIGASQGGIILGRADLIGAVRKNPIARMVRVCKMTLAVLEATLTLLLDEPRAMREIPTLRMLSRVLGDIAEQAERIADAVRKRAPQAHVSTADGFSQMGSGSLPGQNLPTRLVAIKPEAITPDAPFDKLMGPSDAEGLALALRRHEPPVFTRIRNDELLIDPRTLSEGEEQIVIEALVETLGTEA